MLNKIIEFSIKNSSLVFYYSPIGYGSYQFTQLPIDAVPDITDNQVQIITSAPSLGATDIERLITFPIGTSQQYIPTERNSKFSSFWLISGNDCFNDTDVYWARQQVTERLSKDQIPSVGDPFLAPVTTLVKFTSMLFEPNQVTRKIRCN
jgi:cobalt-zinc-cadmium resistance protein CzcA